MPPGTRKRSIEPLLQLTRGIGRLHVCSFATESGSSRTYPVARRELGAFEPEAGEYPAAAVAHLRRAYGRDPFGPTGPLLAEAPAETGS